jgi:hypothetical protein
MLFQECPTIAEIKTLFAGEIAAAGGVVSDTFEDESHLFTRSILPQAREVRPADRMQGGVALRAGERSASIHPYVFRLVCRNGAIMAQALQTRRIAFEDFATPEEALEAMREAIRACSAEDAFHAAVEQIRTAREIEADAMLNLIPLLSHLHLEAGSPLLNTILGRFFHEGGRSRFDLMNAVTSVARDTTDADLRWRLEELGGGVAAGRTPVLQPDDTAAAMLA